MIDEVTTIEFEYNKIKTKVEIEIEQLFQDAVKIYLTKEKLDLDSIEFIHNDKKINLNDKIESLMTNINNDKDNIIPIKVITKNNNIKNNLINNVKFQIKCPKCSEPCRIKIENYLIKLFDCKNNHKTENIELDQIGKILNEINQNQIIENNKKFYICEEHQNPYTDYCTNCKLNICSSCKVQHMNHNIQTYSGIKPNIDEIKNKMKGIKKAMNLLDVHIQEIIKYLNNVKENMDIYYDIYNNIINNYDENKKNYEILQSLIDINNDNIIEEINHVINFETKRKGYNILNIYNKMKEFNNEITINYSLDQKKNSKSKNNKRIVEEEINIFGPEFVSKNKDICKIIYEEQLFDLSQKFKINYNNITTDTFTLKLKGIQKVKNMEQLFKECPSLYSVPDIDKWDVSAFTDIHGLFFNCKSLISLPDISTWDVSNIKDFNHLFSGCASLISLPDLSKWNLNNAVNIYAIFHKCSSLKSLPDISNWNTKKVTNLYGLFLECSSLLSLPDISKWNTDNVNNLSGMFIDCKCLTTLPDISKWNTGKVFNLSGIFAGCSNLQSIPDISKWDIGQVNNLSGMFANCSSLTSLPDISVWNTDNVTNLKFMFYNCSSLSSLPNINRWNIEKVTNVVEMFAGCKLFLNIPAKFKNKNLNQ